MMKWHIARAKKNGWCEWVQPINKGYLMQCCDCNLVHKVDFRIVEGHIQLRMKRMNKMTEEEQGIFKVFKTYHKLSKRKKKNVLLLLKKWSEKELDKITN